RRLLAKIRAAIGLSKHARGAQPGNSNRLIHGRYTRARAQRRAAVQTLLRNTRALIAHCNALITLRRAASAAPSIFYKTFRIPPLYASYPGGFP
ncbi:MAG: hypothetical protein JO167_06205, partial [Alphaproteobacteria bacterium]|nr:hypothetical protein [Alphaproteobacteria bacterium]